ncbi:uncharacterized protein LOC121382178 [Gigantopelta aegis]|uniref:uncharacterized protein LOC121382178 n=1 Tax=Gigantopelta aegis TaxID=1735272 RepID=UPI001B88DE29|nr:uncharacterized protein LOC121382178 [Gigantopelta aegis]
MKLSSTSCGFLVLLLSIQLADSCVDPTGVSCLWYFWFILFWIGIGIFVLVVIVVNKIQQKFNKVNDIFLTGYKSNAPTNGIQHTIGEGSLLQTGETNNVKLNDEPTYPPHPVPDQHLYHKSDQGDVDRVPSVLPQEQYSRTPSVLTQEQEHISPFILVQEQEQNNRTLDLVKEQEHNNRTLVLVQEQEDKNRPPSVLTEDRHDREFSIVSGLENQGHTNNTSDITSYQPEETREFISDVGPTPVYVQPLVKDTDTSLNHESDSSHGDKNAKYSNTELSSANKTVSLGSPSLCSLTEPETPVLCQVDIINEQSHPVRYQDIDSAQPKHDADVKQGTDTHISDADSYTDVLEYSNGEVIKSNPDSTTPEETTVHNVDDVTVQSSPSLMTTNANTPPSPHHTSQLLTDPAESKEQITEVVDL